MINNLIFIKKELLPKYMRMNSSKCQQIFWTRQNLHIRQSTPQFLSLFK